MVEDLAVGMLGVQYSAEMLKVVVRVVKLAEPAAASRAVMALDKAVAA